MEDRALARANLMAAVGTTVALAARNAMKGISLTTLAGEAVGMALLPNVVQAGGIIGELLVKLLDCVAFVFHGD
jgi:hypothetical protein